MKIIANALLSVSLTLLAVGHAVAQAPAPAPALSEDALKALAAQIAAHWTAKEWAQAEALTRQVIAATPTPAASRLRDLRNLLGLQGKTDEATKLGLEIAQRTDANSDDHTAICWHFLTQNQALQARPYCASAVKLNSGNLAALVNLGHTYLLTGDAVAAQPWYAKTLTKVRTEATLKEGPLGDFDLFIKNGWQVPAATAARNWFETGLPIFLNLRRTAITIGNEAKSVPLLEQALQQSTELLGADNDFTQILIERLGSLLNDAGTTAYINGDMPQANQWFQKSVTLRQTKLGADHPDTLTSMSNLAVTYSDLGQHDKALAMNEKVLAARQTKLGAAHHDTLTSMGTLASTYSALGQNDKALAMEEKVLQSQRWGPYPPRPKYWR